MDEKQAQLQRIQAQIAQEQSKGAAERNDAKIAELENEEAAIRAQLDEAANQQQVEDKVAEAQAAVTQSFDAITIGDEVTSLRALTVNEQAYQIASMWIQSMVMAQAEREAQISYQNAQLQQQVTNLTGALNNATADLKDRDSKLKNAADEIDRLNDQVDDLRKEISVGAKAAIKVTDTNLDANLGEMIKQFKAQLPAIYDIEPVDNKRSMYRAKYMETGEEFTFGYLEKGKYREVTADEAERFQAEQAAQQSQIDIQQNTALDLATPPSPPSLGGIVTEDSFPPEVPNDNDTNGGDAALSAVVGQANVEARLQALEARVAKLEVAA